MTQQMMMNSGCCCWLKYYYHTYKVACVRSFIRMPCVHPSVRPSMCPVHGTCMQRDLYDQKRVDDLYEKGHSNDIGNDGWHYGMVC